MTTALVAVLTGLPVELLGQSQPEALTEEAVREKILEIFRKTREAGQYEVDGVKAWTRFPPSNESVEEILALGDRAIPVLTEFLRAEQVDRHLTLRFLGLLGGERVVPALRLAARENSWPTIRMLALEWLVSISRELALPILKESAEKDPDPEVRKKAEELLGLNF